MKQNAQAHLAQRLAEARAGGPAGQHEDWQKQVLATFRGAVEALHAVDAISPEEASDWMGRALVALGQVSRDSSTAISGGGRAGSFLRGGADIKHDDPDISRGARARFLGLIPVPNAD